MTTSQLELQLQTYRERLVIEQSIFDDLSSESAYNAILALDELIQSTEETLEYLRNLPLEEEYDESDDAYCSF